MSKAFRFEKYYQFWSFDNRISWIWNFRNFLYVVWYPLLVSNFLHLTVYTIKKSGKYNTYQNFSMQYKTYIISKVIIM